MTLDLGYTYRQNDSCVVSVGCCIRSFLVHEVGPTPVASQRSCIQPHSSRHLICTRFVLSRLIFLNLWPLASRLTYPHYVHIIYLLHPLHDPTQRLRFIFPSSLTGQEFHLRTKLTRLRNTLGLSSNLPDRRVVLISFHLRASIF